MPFKKIHKRTSKEIKIHQKKIEQLKTLIDNKDDDLLPEILKEASGAAIREGYDGSHKAFAEGWDWIDGEDDNNELSQWVLHHIYETDLGNKFKRTLWKSFAEKLPAGIKEGDKIDLYPNHSFPAKLEVNFIIPSLSAPIGLLINLVAHRQSKITAKFTSGSNAVVEPIVRSILNEKLSQVISETFEESFIALARHFGLMNREEANVLVKEYTSQLNARVKERVLFPKANRPKQTSVERQSTRTQFMNALKETISHFKEKKLEKLPTQSDFVEELVKHLKEFDKDSTMSITTFVNRLKVYKLEWNAIKKEIHN